MTTLEDLLKVSFGEAEDYLAKMASADMIGFDRLADGSVKTAGAETVPTDDVLKLAEQCELYGSQLTKLAGEAPTATAKPTPGGTQSPPLKDPGYNAGPPDAMATMKSNSVSTNQMAATPLQQGQSVANTENSNLEHPGENAQPPKMADAAIFRIYTLLKTAVAAAEAAAPTPGGTQQPETAESNDGTGIRMLSQGAGSAQVNRVSDNKKVQDLNQGQATEQHRQEASEMLNETPPPPEKQEPAKGVIEGSGTESASAKSAEVIVNYAEYLNKLAEQGCTCGGQGTCGYCQIKAALADTLSGDAAAAGIGGTMGAVGGADATSGGNVTVAGMEPVAQAPVEPPAPAQLGSAAQAIRH